jgi:hypothetical protein
MHRLQALEGARERRARLLRDEGLGLEQQRPPLGGREAVTRLEWSSQDSVDILALASGLPEGQVDVHQSEYGTRPFDVLVHQGS